MIKYNLLVFAVMSWLVCLASCNTNLNLEDGVYYFETKPSLWLTIDYTYRELSGFTEEHYLIPMKLNINHEKQLEDLISDTKYEDRNLDLASCIVNGCFVNVKDRKITSIVYTTCNNFQLIKIGKEYSDFKSKFLTDDGEAKLHSLFLQVRESNMDIEHLNFPPGNKK